MTRWTWLIAALASLLVFLWLSPSERSQTSDLTESIGGDDPDLNMTRGTITQYDEDGSLRYHLSFAQVNHYTAKAETYLVEPTLTLDRAPQFPWLASANEGWVSQQGRAEGSGEEVVYLQHNVRLLNSDPAQRLELSCEEMYVYPARRFAETHQPVMITSDLGHTVAAALSGDLNTDMLKLSSSRNQRVHTVVLPGKDSRIRPQVPASGR